MTDSPITAPPLPNPLRDLHDNAGAEFQSYAALEVVSTFGEPQAEYAAIRKASALFDQPQRGILELTGEDRLSFINNMLTNQTWDKAAKTGLTAGTGVYAFFLNGKGRIVTDINVIERGDRTWLDMDARLVESTRLAFDKFLFRERVKMTNKVGSLHTLALHGPGAIKVLEEVCALSNPVGSASSLRTFSGSGVLAASDGLKSGEDAASTNKFSSSSRTDPTGGQPLVRDQSLLGARASSPALFRQEAGEGARAPDKILSLDADPTIANGLSAPLGSIATRLFDVDAVIWRDDACGVPGFHIVVDSASVEKVWTGFLQRFFENNEPGRRLLRPAGWAAFNATRIEAGRPIFGVDFDDTVLPAETGQLDRAVSFTKGCYLGQEIVARMHARGQVARQIVGLRMTEDALPMAGTLVYDDKDNQVGGITSSTVSPVLSNACICLGFVKKAFIPVGSVVKVPAEGAMRLATIVALPFVSGLVN